VPPADDVKSLFSPRYDLPRAARYIRMPESTLRAWCQGMGSFRAVLDTPTRGYLSFVNLTEAFVLHAMRRHYKVKLQAVRPAIDYVQQAMGVEHPLAFQRFRTDKVHLFVESLTGEYVNASLHGQTILTDLQTALDRIQWQNDRPVALFPLVRRGIWSYDKPLKISPLVAFGKPVITGTGIPVLTVVRRFQAGESVQSLADDYDLKTEAIEEAIRAETIQTAA
jgi:uncharacterized protein (DUF433 family)